MFTAIWEAGTASPRGESAITGQEVEPQPQLFLWEQQQVFPGYPHP